VKTRKKIAAATALTAGLGGAFVLGQATGTSSAEAAATHAYTLRVGDRITVPAIHQMCAVYTEGGAPELFCARRRNARHQVAIFRDRIQVWKNGQPAGPVWSGRP
jgi:hypothetical protein